MLSQELLLVYIGSSLCMYRITCVANTKVLTALGVLKNRFNPPLRDFTRSPECMASAMFAMFQVN